jgi:aryl-alcohol dehydrogenase-like predicted oxidoreductase
VIAGTVQLGLPYGAANDTGLPDEGEALATLEAVAAAGITHVDTARAYGSSEHRIGLALARPTTSRLRVVTKVRPLDDLPPDAPAEQCEAAVTASLAASFDALGGAVETVLVHRAADWWRPGVVPMLEAQRGAGRCLNIGVSVQRPAELAEVLADPRCTYVQMPFNLLDHRWLSPSILDRQAARPDVVLTCRSVFLQGLLTVRTARWPANAGVPQERVLDAIDDLVHRLRRDSPADLCLAYVLGHDWVTSAVVGVETPSQGAALGDLARRPPLDAAQIDEVRATMGRVPDPLLDPSSWRF